MPKLDLWWCPFAVVVTNSVRETTSSVPSPRCFVCPEHVGRLPKSRMECHPRLIELHQRGPCSGLLEDLQRASNGVDGLRVVLASDAPAI